MEGNWKYLGELPSSGYEYKFIQQKDFIQIIGVSQNEKPRMFILIPYQGLKEVDIEGEE